MTQGRLNWASAGILIAVFISLLHGTDSARAAPTLEARFALDSNSCPVAVDLWLRLLKDTVVGLEIVLQWDRPDFARFRIDSLVLPDTLPVVGSRTDTLRNISRRTNPKPIPVIELDGTILDTWAYVEGRTKDGLRVKITGLMNLFSGSGATPVFPCDSIRLFRLPIYLLTHGNRSPADSTASVLLEHSQTRLSTNWGNLVGGLKLVGAITRSTKCASKNLQR